ncbi:hypothetical protein Mp_3g07960 [Marchantia polymorpha subsp. ruderalis]|uniref:Uncharacterized protein n=2 Tax=Marchantia polymorpha TaxID=3197 RepID=A0AAF6AYJ3_MARPO|nr:hypothetical protein MARPO_0006s0273 [Marchantia polymorpha]BBN04827.1 hypothetical protein Mp_3g07960 [Marchantia polymorpha subsp. ruderalis]|eukprot:PTQ48280.1 hypothetical protein MARPO_0006s0273 [Marchantia polymorpha]
MNLMGKGRKGGADSRRHQAKPKGAVYMSVFRQAKLTFGDAKAVILDKVSKYLIFLHLNRISPSIIATYHTMKE